MFRVRISSLLMVVAPFVLFATLRADTANVTVQGYMDPYLAGMPTGSTAKAGDMAPAQSPLLALTGFQVGTSLSFATSSNCGFAYIGGCGPYAGGDSSADGDLGVDGFTGAENGLSGVNSPWNALLGVFLNGTAPDGTPAPADLNFSGVEGIGLNFSTVNPALKQVFFIGDGLTGRGSGTIQQFVAPAGATRLFLGSMDGSGWYNNGGFQNVTITYTPTNSGAVPEPATFFLLGGSLLGLVALIRKSASGK